MKIYNSLTGKKEILETLEPNRVKMYVCGMTVYDHTHIGHARTFLCFDVIVRYLRYAGFTVDYIRNITDVDDKIIERSKKLNIEALELTSKYINSMQYDFNSLGMIDPDQEPKATENILSIIKLIEKLIEKIMLTLASLMFIFLLTLLQSMAGCRDVTLKKCWLEQELMSMKKNATLLICSMEESRTRLSVGFSLG